MYSLKEWCSNELVDSFERGQIETYQLDLPFRTGWIENFFKEDVFALLQRETAEADVEKFSVHPWKYLYTPFLNKDFFRFIHGKNFLNFLQVLAGKEVKRFEDFPYPQIHHFKSKAKGLNVHTDYGTGRQFATLMYMNDDWQVGMGGELELFREKEGEYSVAASVQPKANSMFYFEVTPISYHAVKPMNGDWRRETIITDWQFA